MIVYGTLSTRDSPDYRTYRCGIAPSYTPERPKIFDAG